MDKKPFHRQLLTIKVLLITWCLIILPTAVNGQSFTISTHSIVTATYLLDVRQDTQLSLKARALREGGYETAGGERINFSRWYAPDSSDIQISWLTQLNRNFGLIWGFGTGESAEKYTISPSLRLGFTYQIESKNRRFALTATTILGGELREKSCTADYGDIGGVQEVNCRLAATTLTPEETLNYLEYAKPESVIKLSFTYFF